MGLLSLRHDDGQGEDPSASKPKNPETLEEVIEELQQALPHSKQYLISAVRRIYSEHREIADFSKNEAIRVLRNGFAVQIEKLRGQLAEKDVTVSVISQYFEEVVADLMEKNRRDSKTKLLNLEWFTERLEAFIAVEKRKANWCAIGVVDITSFKYYNDSLGHAAGDRIIDRVAKILSDQIRSGDDLLALERDLHARYGGDEFCFLIQHLDNPDQGVSIAQRFKDAVHNFDWSTVDSRIGGPIGVDVGVICLRLGSLEQRQGSAKSLASELIHTADTLMYGAKGDKSTTVRSKNVYIIDGKLIEY